MKLSQYLRNTEDEETKRLLNEALDEFTDRMVGFFGEDWIATRVKLLELIDDGTLKITYDEDTIYLTLNEEKSFCLN